MPKIFIRLTRPTDRGHGGCAFAASIELEPVSFGNSAQGLVDRIIDEDVAYRKDRGLVVVDRSRYTVHDGTPRPNKFECQV